jgi:hypothetical protein
LDYGFETTLDRPLAFNAWFVHNDRRRSDHVKTGETMPTTADAAKSMYLSELKETLERDHKGEYVAIVSPTRRHYIGTTFLEAAMAAREAEPDYIPFVIRIGYDAAFHIGAAKT